MPSSHPVTSILLCHTNRLHVPFHSFIHSFLYVVFRNSSRTFKAVVECGLTFVLLVCLPFDAAYWFLQLGYQLIVTQCRVRIWTFFFIVQKGDINGKGENCFQDRNNHIILLTQLQFFASICADSMLTLS